MTLLGFYREILRQKYTHLRNETASYAFRRQGRTLWLYFESSNGRTDWCNNLDFPAVAHGKDRDRHYIHRGFLRVFQALEPALRPLITAPGIGRILIGGYSHGAALALLCHEACMLTRPELGEEIYGYGYGCPRVLWGPIRPAVRERFVHFTVIRNGRDIVTHVPPALLGYRHVGEMAWVGRDTSLSPIDDHRPENYLRALSASPIGDARVGEPLPEGSR